jgi:hypothetical protein
MNKVAAYSRSSHLITRLRVESGVIHVSSQRWRVLLRVPAPFQFVMPIVTITPWPRVKLTTDN